jgi:hypothetical protein
VYVKAHNVMTRNAGCRLFERFAEATHVKSAATQPERSEGYKQKGQSDVS